MATRNKQWWKSKTVWVAVLQGIVSVLAVILSENPEIKAAGIIMITKSIIDFGLRYSTTDPIKL